jgi:hypothetical protein
MLIQDQNPTGGQTRYISGVRPKFGRTANSSDPNNIFKKSKNWQRTGSSFMKPSSSLRGLKYPEPAVL